MCRKVIDVVINILKKTQNKHTKKIQNKQTAASLKRLYHVDITNNRGKDAPGEWSIAKGEQ
jgi:hypothetical protein